MTFELYRDDLGVPHVRAGTEPDLAYGQGYVTALDRGWQVEVDRWRAEGRLAARLGPGGLDWDRFAVRVRLADTAQAVFAALPAPEQEWLRAYVAGMNAGLLAGGRDVPELAALDRLDGTAPRHEPWPDWAPVGIFLVAHLLFSGFPNVLWRDHVARTLGPEHVGLFATDGGPSSGSNAWALHGSRTATGAPLLAGDPHRIMELPGVYQQVRLACDDYDVLGLAFPGVPGVPHFGHAGTVAWGITNALAHHVEVFTERLADVGGAPHAHGPDGWGPVATGVETVPVRGGAPVEVRWAETPRGPVVSGLPDDDGAAPAGPAFSVRLPARADADLGVPAWRALLRARTADDVARALEGWVDPVNRVLVADSGGTVLRLTAGRVPRRDVAERALPLPAWTDAARPRPWRRLPAAEPVPAVPGFAVDANERPARPRHDLGWSYCEHRADRIAELLAAGPPEGFTAAGLDPVLGDTRHLGAATILAHLAAALPVPDAAAARLQRWADGGAPMDAASAEAALFARFRHALVRRVAAHPALAPLHAPHHHDAILAPWFSVVARVGDGLAHLLRSGLVDARAEALAAWAEATGEDPDGPGAVGPETTWGDVHRLLPLHALAEAGLAADLPAVPSLPLSGDTDTVRCTSSVPGATDLSWRGSVARWVWDLGDRDRSRWGVPFGASGDPRSPHFLDQHETWAAAATAPVTTDWARLRPVRPQDRTDERATA